MSDKYILVGREPQPVDDVLVWGDWYQRADRTVVRTGLRGIEVSTVFLALDHSFNGSPPLLFEPIAFGPPDQPEQPERVALIDLVGQRRCSTWAQAEAQHQRAVDEVRAWKEPSMTDFTRSRDGRESTAVDSRRDGRLVAALFAIATAIVFASKKVDRMTTAIENLTNAVHQAETVAQSAVTLISGLSGQLRAAKNNPNAVEALATELDASTAQLSTAITANTPAASAPTSGATATAGAVTGTSTAADLAPAESAPAPASDPATAPATSA